MWLSRSRRVLFVHVQKTGGTAVAEYLQRGIPDLQRFLGTHDPAEHARDALGDAFEEYWRFAFVRNPWDRLVSWYAMIDQARGEPNPPKFWTYVWERASSFPEFLERCTDEVTDVDGRKSALLNQVDYVTGRDGRLLVDFVGRFESLEQGVARIVERLDLPLRDPVPRRNPSVHGHYSRYYSAETRALVAERFARDIRAFDYGFEDAGPGTGPG